MALTRRAFVGRSGATVVGLGLASSLGLPAFAQASDTIKIALSARGLRTIDPARSIQGADEWAIIHIYDTLVEVPLGYFPATVEEVQPSLAESWTSNEDATVWTFKLREDVEFQKGYGALTSEDVKYTFDRLLDPEELGVRSSLYQNLESVEVDGPHTVVMTLKQPDPLWVMGALLHHSASIISKKAHEEKGDTAFETDPIGTGPYELVSVEQDPSQGVKLTANPTYWGEAPATPNMQVLYISDTTARTLALLSGDIHLMEGVRSPGWVPSMQAQAPDLHFDVASPGSFFTISFNLTAPPFDDVRVRQAMAYLIDRDRIAQAMAPFGQRTWGMNPPSFPGGFDADTIPAEVAYTYDVEKAQALLAEAGFPDGLSFQAYTSQREDYSSIALMIQEMLREGGVDMQLEMKDHTAFHADQATGTNTLFQRSGAYPPVPTQAISEQLTAGAEVKPDSSGGPNFSHYGVAMPGIDEMLAATMEEPDLAKRIEMVQEIEVKFLTDMPLLPVVTNGYMIVRAPNLDLGYDLKSGYAHWRLDKASFS
jgi:peptide/nickel transport system substrate-binding protein